MYEGLQGALARHDCEAVSRVHMQRFAAKHLQCFFAAEMEHKIKKKKFVCLFTSGKRQTHPRGSTCNNGQEVDFGGRPEN